MSIFAYTGLAGHGKTYGVVENVILPALKAKRTVFTNIPINQTLCLDTFGISVVPFQTDDIKKNPQWFTQVFEAGSLFVFDEVWRLWPAGLKASNISEEHKTFLAEHRHIVGANGLSTEIFLVTQDLSQIAVFARLLVESTFRVQKLGVLGFDNRYRVDVYSGFVTGPRPPISKREREIHGGRYKKEVYQFYKSHTKSVSGLVGDETKTDQRANGLKRLSIKLGLLLAVICLFVVYLGFNRIREHYSKPEIKVAEPASVKPLTPKSNIQPSSGIVNPRLSAIKSPQVPQQIKFLSAAKRLIFSHTIKVGTGPEVGFYKITFTDSEALLSDRELRSLGYTVARVTDCVVKVVGSDYSGFILCSKSERRPVGLIAGFSSDVSGAVAGSSQ